MKSFFYVLITLRLQVSLNLWMPVAIYGKFRQPTTHVLKDPWLFECPQKRNTWPFWPFSALLASEILNIHVSFLCSSPDVNMLTYF